MAGGKVVQLVKGLLSPHIRCYFLISTMVYLVTAAYMYVQLYGRIIPVLCSKEIGNPADPPMNCTRCDSDFFICNMCQVEDIPPGYKLKSGMGPFGRLPDSWVKLSETQFVTFDKLEPQCLPGFDYMSPPGHRRRNVRPSITCPRVNGTFTFAGCPENRCKVFPRPGDPTRLDMPTTRYVISERRNMTLLTQLALRRGEPPPLPVCQYTRKYVKKSDCTLSCKKPTAAQLAANPKYPEYHKKRGDGSFEVPVALSCPVHKGAFGFVGCEDKCEVPLSIKGSPPKYDGLMANAPGFEMLDRFLKSKDVYIANPYWEVRGTGIKRLVGYVNKDFLNGGLYLSDLDAIDVLFWKFTDFDRNFPAFIVKYSSVGVAVYNVTDCDTSVKGYIWQADCKIHCAPGFGEFPGVVHALPDPDGAGPAQTALPNQTCPAHAEEFQLVGCEHPWMGEGPFTGSFGPIPVSRRLTENRTQAENRTQRILLKLNSSKASRRQSILDSLAGALIERARRMPSPSPSPSPSPEDGGGGGGAGPSSDPLPAWDIGPWSRCSCPKQCMEGLQTRTYECSESTVCAGPAPSTERKCYCGHCANCPVENNMLLIIGSYAVQGLAALLVTLAFVRFAGKAEGASMNIFDKLLGCLCKTLPVTVRGITIITFFQLLLLFTQSYLPQCPKNDNGVALIGQCGFVSTFGMETLFDACRRDETGMKDVSLIASIVFAVQLVMGFYCSSAKPPAWLYAPMKPGKGAAYKLKKVLRSMGP